MKLKTTLTCLMLVIAAAAALYLNLPNDTDSAGENSLLQTQKTSGPSTKIAAKLEGASEYKKYLYTIRKNPYTGRIDFADVAAARQQVKIARAESNATARDLGLAWELMGPTNVGGRTRAVMISRSNPMRMYAGSVSGGLFLSDNGGLSWYPHPQNPLFESTLISTIVEAANGDIYFGTGESFSGFYDGIGSFTHAFTGNGVYKSTDGGNTFSLLTNTEPTPGTIGAGTTAEWAYVNRLAAHPTDAGTLLAATQRGLYYTTDGGANWSYAVRDGNNMLSTAVDCLFGPDGVAHAIYINTYTRNDGADLTNFSSSSYGAGLPLPSQVSRAVIAVAPSDPNYVYLYAARQVDPQTSSLQGIYQSTDAGANFSQISPGSGTSTFNPPGGQANYNLCIGVSPADPERIYIGGQTTAWSWNPTTGWNTIAASFFGAANSRYIHADHHQIVFHPSNPNIMYFATDGGVYRSQNATAEIPDFSDLNKGYSTFQAHGIGAGLNGEVLAGSQDNGTAYVNFSLNEPTQSLQVLGGDGAETEISKIRPGYLFSSFYSFGSGSGALRRSANDGSTFISFFDANIDPNLDGIPEGGADFVEADLLWEDYDKWHIFGPVLSGESVEWPVGSGTMVSEGETVTYEGASLTLTEENILDARFFYGSESSGLWFTPQPLQSSTLGAPEWFQLGLLNVNVTAVASSENGDHVYFGTETGQIYRVSGMNTADFSYASGSWDPVAAGLTITRIHAWTGYITGIAVASDNPDEVVITRGGYGVGDNVRRCTNGTTAGDNTANFTSISSSLPGLPVFDCMINRYNNDEILLATEFGVWSYDVSDPTTAWSQETSIVGNVPVFEIRQDVMREPGCYPIYIATHGRGMFRATNHVDLALGCDFEIRSETTGLDDAPAGTKTIKELTLAPNPSCLRSQLTVQLTAGGMTHIVVYDLTGRERMEIASQNLSAGVHQFDIATSELERGAYLVAVRQKDEVRSIKLLTCEP